jgi:hypothetical protein
MDSKFVSYYYQTVIDLQQALEASLLLAERDEIRSELASEKAEDPVYSEERLNEVERLLKSQPKKVLDIANSMPLGSILVDLNMQVWLNETAVNLAIKNEKDKNSESLVNPIAYLQTPIRPVRWYYTLDEIVGNTTASQ